MKACSKCKIDKPLDEFHKNKSAKDGFNNQCKCCQKENYVLNAEARKEYAKANWAKWYSAKKASTDKQGFVVKLLRAARRRGLAFDLDSSDIELPTHCKYLGYELSYDLTEGRVPNRASLDRIDSSKGYVKGNVQIISNLANTMKNSATKEELLTFAVNICNEFL